MPVGNQCAQSRIFRDNLLRRPKRLGAFNGHGQNGGNTNMPATSGTFRGSVGGRWSVSSSPASGRATRSERRRPGGDHPRRIIAAGFGLIAVFGAGLLLSGYVPFSLSLRSTPETALRDPDDFTRNRIGEVFYPIDRSNACRKNFFYNDSGLFGPDMKVRCDTGLAEDQTASVGRALNGSGRLMSIRDAFVRR